MKKGVKVGYARVSTRGQNLDSQLAALEKADCEKIFQEKKSGTTTDERTELANALNYVREGDTFVVTRLDRFARSMKDLSNMVHELNDRGVAFICTEQHIDTSTSTGRLMLNVLASIAEFETDLRAERQAEGTEAAKKKGVQFGRPKVFDDEKCIEALQMKADGKNNDEICSYFNIKVRTLQTYLKDYREKLRKEKTEK